MRKIQLLALFLRRWGVLANFYRDRDGYAFAVVFGAPPSELADEPTEL